MSPAAQYTTLVENYNRKRLDELKKIIIDAGHSSELTEMLMILSAPYKTYEKKFNKNN